MATERRQSVRERRWTPDDLKPSREIHVPVLRFIVEWWDQGKGNPVTQAEATEALAGAGFPIRKRGSVFNWLLLRQKQRHLSPPLVTRRHDLGKGRWEINMLEYEGVIRRALKMYQPPEPEPSVEYRLDRIARSAERFQGELRALQEDCEAIREELQILQKQGVRRLEFTHTSFAFAGSVYGSSVTSIKGKISEMLRRATRTIRIASLRIDMFVNELIDLKSRSPDLDIVVIHRGDARGERRRFANTAHDLMKGAGIKVLVQSNVFILAW